MGTVMQGDNDKRVGWLVVEERENWAKKPDKQLGGLDGAKRHSSDNPTFRLYHWLKSARQKGQLWAGKLYDFRV